MKYLSIIQFKMYFGDLHRVLYNHNRNKNIEHLANTITSLGGVGGAVWEVKFDYPTGKGF